MLFSSLSVDEGYFHHQGEKLFTEVRGHFFLSWGWKNPFILNGRNLINP